MSKLGDKAVPYNRRGKFHALGRARTRVARVADLPDIAGICTERYHELYGRFTAPTAMEYYLKPFHFGILRKEHRAWRVLILGNAVAGCVRMVPHPEWLALDKCYLARAASGRRLGEFLLHSALPKRACIRVQVFVPNQSARRFFTRMGFRIEGPCRWSYRGRVQHGVQMKRLPVINP